jgi:hypothetical protein
VGRKSSKIINHLFKQENFTIKNYKSLFIKEKSVQAIEDKDRYNAREIKTCN